jgi:signal transduction histidine kinase
MLALSRIDSGELRLSRVEFDLTALTGQTLLSFEKRIEEKNITIEGLEETPTIGVYGDFDLLGQVIYNLLDNAVKFVNQDGCITIGLTKEKGSTLWWVRNTGAGIPATEMPHIFERFYKSDRSRSLDKNGVGLGLYIVQTVLSLHDGEVMVRSEEGQYTEFLFRLPDGTGEIQKNVK